MELKKIENTNIYEFRSNDRLTEEEAKKLSQSFEEFKRNGEKISLLGIIEKIPLPKDFSILDDLIKLKISSINVIEKYAVLSDKEWLENLVPVANFFTPGLPIRTFELNQRNEAINWLNEKSIKEYSPEDYLSNIDIKKIGANAFEIHIPHKKINHAAMSAMYNVMGSQENNEKLNILIVFESFPSFDSFKAMVEGIKVDFKAIGRIDKYAIVSDAKWTETYTKIGDFITPGMDMKFFAMEELKIARRWAFNRENI